MANVEVYLEGYGLDTWGSQGWGETYYEDGLVTSGLGTITTAVDFTFNATGFDLTTALGTATMRGDVDISTTGFPLTVNLGQAKSIVGVFIRAVGFEALPATGTLGQVSSYYVAGVEATLSLGSVKTFFWSDLPMPSNTWNPVPTPTNIWTDVPVPPPNIWTVVK